MPLSRKRPVNDFLFWRISSGVPTARSSPPFLPAPGPRSMIRSARNISSSSCSTTSSEFPLSRKVSRVEINRSLSRACSPILGSSST